MKILVAACNFTPAKAYVMPKFRECMRACCLSVERVDVIVIGDQVEEELDWEPMELPAPTTWQDDMTLVGRQRSLDIARELGYDRLVIQGVDCLYDSREDFIRLVVSASDEWTLMGALTSARTDSSYAVARRFVDRERTTEQVDIHRSVLETGEIVEAGFPGADALVVHPRAYDKQLADGYTSWYNLRAQEPHSLCVEEWWCWRIFDGIGLNTSVRTWHVHEDMTARRWPDETMHLSELSWEAMSCPN